MIKRAFRLFVSSTFKDFVEERRLLQEKVFPALESYCALRGYGFRAIDMRWGVSEGAQLDQRTAEICLDEVREAKAYPAPNLLILIGDRYGWSPLPFAIAQDEFEAARDWLKAHRRDVVALLDRVYQRDDNHLIACGLYAPPGQRQMVAAYTLRSREDDLADLKSPDAWAKVEMGLREALQAAAQHFHDVGRLDAAGRDKYFLSLTEQEIRTGLEAMEAEVGKAAPQTIAWIQTTSASEPQVKALAASLQQALPARNVVLNERADFVLAVTAKLEVEIDQHIATMQSRAEAPDFVLDAERAIHKAFAAERLRVFVGRHSNRAAIAAYVAGGARHPYVLRGISGSGKTALMARAAADAEASRPLKVVKRFVGASAASADQRSLLVSIIEDLAELGIAQEPERWEDDANRFAAQIRDLIAAIDQPVAIFVDAIDQIRAPYRPAWLPAELKPKVKIVISVLDDQAFAAERETVGGLQRRLPPEAFLEIEPLSAGDARDILAGLERQAQRGLQSVQRDFIIERFIGAGASPLYLSIAFAIARRWRSTTDPRARGLAGDATALIAQFIDELWTVHHHAPILVRRTLGLLAAGREGLSESELVAVLSRDGAVMQAISSERFGARTARLPDSVWVRLKRSLAALLVEKAVDGEPLLQFFHRQVAEVVRSQFYGPEQTTLHKTLANYFDAPVSTVGEAAFGRRSLSELPYQLFQAGDRGRLDALFADPAWIERKVMAFGGVAELVEDYEAFADQSDPLQPLIDRTLRLAARTIMRNPNQLAVQLHGRLLGAGTHAEDIGPRARFLDALLARVPDGALIETRAAMTAPGGELARLEGHEKTISTLAVLPDGRLASGSEDGSIRIWDPASGAEIVQLKRHPGFVTALAAMPDGRLASGDSEGNARLWDAASGAEILRLGGHRGWVNSLASLQDGRLASGDSDGTIRLWDLASGAETARLQGHSGQVRGLAALQDGRLVSGASDMTIRVWDPRSGVETARLASHGVAALVALPDGRLATCASDDRDRGIRIWDLQSGRELARLEDDGSYQGYHVNALAALPGGRLASGSSDNSVRLWDLATEAQTARLEGHQAQVTSLAALPDGRLASGAVDRTIRLWDIASELVGPDEGRGEVAALIELPDGRVASGDSNGVVRLWDSATGAETARMDCRAGWGVTALAVLPDGRLASSAGKRSRVWDLATGAESGALADRHQWNREWISAMVVLPDGRLAGAADDKTIRLWDCATGAETGRIETDARPVSRLAMLPNGRLAGGGADGAIRIWAPATGAEVARFEGHRGAITALAVLPDGRLASASQDGSIRLWNCATGAETARMDGLGDKLDVIAALPDGRLVGGVGASIRLLDIAAGTETARLDLDGRASALVVLADGRLIAGDQFGRLHWLTTKGAVAPSANRSAARSPARANKLAQPPSAAPAIAAKSKQGKRGWAWMIFATIALLATAIAALVVWGRQLGYPAARDALDQLLSMLSLR